MNSLLGIILIVIIIFLIIIILISNRTKSPESRELKRENEMLLKLLDSKLNNQNQLISNASATQNETIKDQIMRIDSNMQKTNNQIENVIRHMFQDIDNKQAVQNKKLDEKNVAFEKQLVKIGTLDESLSNLQERIVDLSMILGNSKARGTFGEIQLYQLIDNYFGINNEVINKQDKLSNNTIVDLSIRSNSMNLKICVDSKFPLENYLEYRETGEVGFKNLFQRDIKKHIDDISKKYIIGGETTNFAIMFIPSEAIYMEVMDDPKLVDYSYRKKTWIASPTTLIALVTMLENINTDYKRMENMNLIESELDKLSVEFDRFNKRYNNLSRHMSQIIGDFEDITITQNKIVNRFEAIKKMDMEGGEDERSE